jgi:hypothetical protein
MKQLAMKMLTNPTRYQTQNSLPSAKNTPQPP